MMSQQYNDGYPPPDPGLTHATRLATGVALAAFGISLTETHTDGWTTILVYGLSMALMFGGMAFVLSYTIIKLAPVIYPDFLYRWEQIDRLRAQVETLVSGATSATPLEEDVVEETVAPDSPGHLLAHIKSLCPAGWRDRVNWYGLAEYVATNPRPEFSERALALWVGHFTYTRRNEADREPKFPATMVAHGLAVVGQGGTYRWTDRGISIFVALHRSPTPAGQPNNGM